MLVFAIAYLLMLFYFGSRWLIFARRNLESTPIEVFLSIIILLLVTIFFPLIIPFYWYKIIKKRQTN
jgi:multisubunit Na+/H+ antiporter MnhB subunit